MTLRDIVVAFGYDVDQASVNEAESSIKGIKNMAKKLLGSLAVVFSVKGISNLAQAAADVEALESQFTQVFGNVEGAASDSLQAVSNYAGAVTNRMKGSFTQIAAFTKTTGANEEEALAVAERGMKAVADSAAFYDRSLEDVTDSLQSFLKGNYANDAALGLSCTETTRNAAANELYGKSFKDLSEYQKQLTLLKMVEDANAASGALGQAARESDTWTNQLGNLKQIVQDFKAEVGGIFLKPAIKALKALISLTTKAVNVVKALKSENGLLTKATEKYHALVKRLQPAVERMTKALSKGMQKCREGIGYVVDMLGGTENALKIAGIAATAFIAVMKWNKILIGAKAVWKVISSIGKIFSFASLKIMAVVAIIVVLALLIEDFIHFLLGHDSVIGTIFDNAGIGADNARKKIFDVWQKIKDFLLEVWDFIKKAAGMFIGTVKDFFVKHMDSIRQNFERVWGLIKTFLDGVWTFISQLASALFGDTEESIDGSQKSTKEKMLAIWEKILETLSAVWDAIYDTANAVFNAVATVVEVVFSWVQSFWNSWGKRILSWFKKLWKSLGGMLNGFLKVVKGIANFISSVFTGDWKGAWEAIKETFAGVWEFIVNFIQSVWETIKLAFELALAAIKELWEMIWNGISSFFQGIWNGIVGFFEGVISTIKSIIEPIADFFTGIFQAAWDGICSAFDGVTSFFKGVWDKITGVFTEIGVTISDAISGTVGKAINAVLGTAVSIINGFISAINTAIGIINEIPGVDIDKLDKLDVPELAEGGIATRATGAIVGEGSEPEAIMPLSKLGSMISRYIKSARENEDTVTILSMINRAYRTLSAGVSALTKAATASKATAATSTTNNSNSSVVQNVEINNSYTGGSRETQKNVSNAMKKSAVDATTQMARSLAYSRG